MEGARVGFLRRWREGASEEEGEGERERRERTIYSSARTSWRERARRGESERERKSEGIYT